MSFKNLPAYFFVSLCSLASLALMPVCNFAQSPELRQSIFTIEGDEYTVEDVRKDFLHAKSLDEADSMGLKAQLLYYVMLFDSTSQMGLLAQQALSALKEHYIQRVFTEIEGEWQWDWSGHTGLGAYSRQTPDSCQCVKKIIVSKDAISYYRDGKLEKTLAYQLYVPDVLVGASFVKLQTEVGRWTVFIGTYENMRMATRSIDGSAFLHISLMEDCICGCPSESYRRKK